MSAAFWASVGVLAYVAAGFPALLALRARVASRPYEAADVEPRVAVVIAARNEREAIPAKLASLLALDYPRDRLQVVVASDGSDDGTVEAALAAARAAGAGPDVVRVLDLPRTGKAGALAAAVAAADCDVLVFSDANSLFRPDALRALVRPFADERVGGVAGNQVYASGPAGGVAAGERRYWDLDRLLKEAESAAGSVISATGAIYAIRRDLFRPIPPDVTDDFAISTGVIARGRRLVFVPDAVAAEPVASGGRAELARKVRVMTRGLRAVVHRRELLNPFRHGFYSLQLLSHKVLRRLAVLPLLAVAATTPFLVDDGLVYQAAAAAQAVLYGAGVAGVALGRTRLGRARPLALPAFFLLVNLAALHALLNLLAGRRLDRWEPARAREGGRASDLGARGAA